MNESIDTLKLRLTDYTISPKANLLLQPCTVNLSEVGSQERQTKRIYSDSTFSIDGSKAYLNNSKFNFTLSDKGAFIQMSVPKIFHTSNDRYVSGTDCAEVLNSVEKELKENGISTDLFNSDLSRVDVFRQSKTRYTFNEYSSVFSLLQGKRQNKRDYGTTYLFSNSNRENCIYDKGVERKLYAGEKDTSPTHDTRVETRLLNKNSIKPTGLITANDLLCNYDYISEIYRKGVGTVFSQKNIIPDGQTEMYFLCQNEIEKELMYLRELRGKLTMKDFRCFVISKGAEYISQVLDIDSFISTFQRLTEYKNKRDVKRQINKFLSQYTYGSKAIPNRTKLLYNELYLKFAV